MRRGNDQGLSHMRQPCFVLEDFHMNEQTRVALLGIIVEDPDAVEALNAILHDFGPYVIGRMGIPYHARNIHIISVVLDAPQDIISNLSGRIGKLKGVTAKTSYAKVDGDHGLPEK